MFMLKSQNLKHFLISIAKGKRFNSLFVYTTDQASLAFTETYAPSMIYLTIAVIGGIITLALSFHDVFKLERKMNVLENSISKSHKSLTPTISTLTKEIEKITELQT